MSVKSLTAADISHNLTLPQYRDRQQQLQAAEPELMNDNYNARPATTRIPDPI